MPETFLVPAKNPMLFWLTMSLSPPLLKASTVALRCGSALRALEGIFIFVSKFC